MFSKFMAVSVLLTVLLVPIASTAAEDTPEARREAVEKYLAIMPLPEMLREMTEEIAKQIPEEQRPHFFDVMNNKIDIPKIEAAAKESLARHLTLAELNHLIAYMEAPEGKSAMKKMKYYMADVMPTMQGEIRRVLAENPPPKPTEN
ncbi:MAG: DUF2059 domain-containing protein [Planctomycetales bacterium]|nr:DUF2059 domain-containing protein [Planctomycetales bacterium]